MGDCSLVLVIAGTWDHGYRKVQKLRANWAENGKTPNYVFVSPFDYFIEKRDKKCNRSYNLSRKSWAENCQWKCK